ncbi:MAG: hypothetical protein FD159_339 [Syntrophaceae bacterium]|nr:MAG: hypothetical protein FD159_339 [Syntrophaceae bacterium]
MKKIGILICVLLLTSCAAGSWISKNPQQLHKPEKRSKTGTIDRLFYEKNYKIGEKITAFVGQEIIRVKSFNEKTAIFSSVKNVEKIARSKKSMDIHAKYNWTDYHIKSEANKEYQIDKTINIGTQRFNLIELNDDKRSKWGILIDDEGAVYNKAIYSIYHELLFYPSYISVSPVVFEISKKVEGEAEEREIEGIIPGMSMELIYSGKNDVSLNATYKEYTPDNMARPAFFQNITYRADVQQLRFKNFVIKLHDVSNEKITYTVLEDGLK